MTHAPECRCHPRPALIQRCVQMNAEEFVQGIIQNTNAAAAGEIAFIQARPPGRSPHPEDVDMHLWFNSLCDKDKSMVRRLISNTARSAAYAILMVLDHKMTIENTEKKGELELYYKSSSGSRVRLNPEGEGRDFEYYFKTS